MLNYSYKKLFLDPLYETTFINCCIKNGLITDSAFTTVDKNEYKYLLGVKKLYRYLVLFEHVDFPDSIYDLSRLIELGIVEKDSQCSSNQDPEQRYLEEATSIMSAYRKQIVNQFRLIVNRDRKDLMHPSCPNADFWRKRNILYYCQDQSGKILNLSKDYYEILRKMDSVRGVGDSPEESFLFSAFNIEISVRMQEIRSNLAYGLKAAEKEKVAYASNYLTLENRTNNNIKPTDDVYYLVKTNLPEEANVMPMPQTLQDVIEMRKSPYVKSFRKVMNEWTECINNNEFAAANKMKRDIVKANDALERIGKFKRFYNTQLARTIICFGGMFPTIGQLLNIISWAEPVVVNKFEEKYNWVLLTKN